MSKKSKGRQTKRVKRIIKSGYSASIHHCPMCMNIATEIKYCHIHAKEIYNRFHSGVVI